MTTTQATAPIGTEIARKQAGAVLITINTASGGYTVNTWAGPDKVTGWCQGYPTWEQARAAANHARDAFQVHLNDINIDRRRQLLIADRDQHARRLAGSRTAAVQNTFRQLIAGIDRELETLEDLSTRALAPTFVADVTRRLAA